MTVKIGINGFGRIGRLALRRILSLKDTELEVVAINDLCAPQQLAHLFKYDTIHGTFDGKVSADDKALYINGKQINVYAFPDAKEIPWVKNDGVDIVLECSGFYTSGEKAQAHIEAGAKKVLISAPAGKIKTVVYNVNLQHVKTAMLHPCDKLRLLPSENHAKEKAKRRYTNV